MAMSSVSAIAHLVFGRLAEAWPRARPPVRGPGDQLPGVDDRQAEQFYRLRSVGEPGRRLLGAGNNGLTAETGGGPRREVAHAEDFVAADIDRGGRRVAMRKAAQRLGRGIALPDEIDMAEADVDRLAAEDLARDVVQHAIAHVDRVIQPEQPAGRGKFAREIFEHALAADAGLRVFAGRFWGKGLK